MSEKEKLEGKWVRIQAYKHDGSFHRVWSYNYIIRENDDYYIACSNRCAVIESNGRKWHTKEPSVFIFAKKRWFNVIAMLKENHTITYYVNLASPTIYDKGYLKFIDYDLDIKHFSDGVTKLLDVGEYKKHTKLLGYDETIRKGLEMSVEYVYSLIEKKEFPFNDETINSLLTQFNKIA